MRISYSTRRIYETAGPDDGIRILVDRLWPRGVSKQKAHIDYWARSIAPSDELRRWYQHDAEKWPEFRRRYFDELDANPEGLAALRAELDAATTAERREKSRSGRRATLVYASRETERNNATALREYLELHPLD